MTEHNSSDVERNKDRPWIFLMALLACFVVWVETPKIIVMFDDTPENRGLTGDMFGAVNALFSGFAFAGVIYAIYLQRNELALQREEMRRATREQENQTLLMQKQIDSLRKSEDFNRYVKHMESEPRLAIIRIQKKNQALSMILANYGKQVIRLWIYPMDDVLYNENYEIKNETLNPNGEIFLSFSIPDDSLAKIRLMLTYQNTVLFNIVRIVQIDLSDYSIVDKYNNFLENLEIPDIYARITEVN